MSQLLGTTDAMFGSMQTSLPRVRLFPIMRSRSHNDFALWQIVGRFSGRNKTRDAFGWGLRSLSGDPTVQAYTMLGQDSMSAIWSFWQRGTKGNGSQKWLRGQVKDANGNAVAATVYGFLTAGDIFVASSATDDKGYYEIPTVYAGQAHFVVAYIVGSPDKTGATVNTLVPTNRDGT